MAKASELPKVVGEIYNLLEPLESADRQKVVSSALTLLGESQPASLGAAPQRFQQERSVADVESEFGSKATRWMKQHAIDTSALEELFHKDGEQVEVIANDVPGNSTKAKAQNCYLLTGISALLATDEPKFTDAEAVALCKHMGCYDKNNHAKARSELGNVVAGSKSNGFTLPAPGLRAAAELVKSMASGN